MNIVVHDSLADVEFQLNWKSAEAIHTDIFYTKVNF